MDTYDIDQATRLANALDELTTEDRILRLALSLASDEACDELAAAIDDRETVDPDAAFFVLTHGLRGCYMPDGTPLHIAATSLDALSEPVCAEIDFLTDGMDVADVPSDAAIRDWISEAWGRRDDPRWTLDLALPMGDGYGAFLSRSTRRDYVVAQFAED